MQNVRSQNFTKLHKAIQSSQKCSEDRFDSRPETRLLRHTFLGPSNWDTSSTQSDGATGQPDPETLYARINSWRNSDVPEGNQRSLLPTVSPKIQISSVLRQHRLCASRKRVRLLVETAAVLPGRLVCWCGYAKDPDQRLGL